MSPLDQMKLTELSLILIILISNTYAQGWSINVMRHINATFHSDVTIPCNFTYSDNKYTGFLEVYWKIKDESESHSEDLDQNAFIFHPNQTYVLKAYKKRTNLTGDIHKGDCSLLIRNISHDVQGMYLRVKTEEKYSFKHHKVNIYVSVDKNQQTQPLLYVYIFVPITAVLLVILVAGIIVYKKRKRVQLLTREESGYYINFRQTSLKEREASSKNQDKQLPQVKNIDEPVYGNVQPPMGYTDSLDQMDDIYANVDVSKLKKSRMSQNCIDTEMSCV